MNRSPHQSTMADDVIGVMYERLSDSLGIDDLAQAANYSKFHFCRLFFKETGVTPSRFLSALRLQQSRRLLLKTDATVSDICCAVGYNSVGTFTSRFTRSIGLSPSVFRSTGGFSPAGSPSGPAAAPGGADGEPSHTIRGRLFAPPDGRRQQILLAAFPSPIPEGQPHWCAVLDGPGSWQLAVPHEGTWYVSAAAISPGEAGYFPSPLLEEQARFVGRTGPIAVSSRHPAAAGVDVRIHPVRRTDPPILFAPPRRLPSTLSVAFRPGPVGPAPLPAEAAGRALPACRPLARPARSHRVPPAVLAPPTTKTAERSR